MLEEKGHHPSSLDILISSRYSFKNIFQPLITSSSSENNKEHPQPQPSTSFSERKPHQKTSDPTRKQKNMQAYCISPCARRSACGPTPPPRTIPTFFPIIPSELAPLFHLLETPSAAATAPAPSKRCGRGPRSRNAPYPRFDVKETAIAYELQGELPGIQQEDISIDFVDADTLVIRGHTAGESKNQSSAEVTISEKEEATTSAAAVESPNTLVGEEKTSDPYKVTVEDEDDEFVDAGAEISDGEGTPATSIAAQPIEAAPSKEDNKKDEHEKDSKPKYWVHERSTGRFERGFRFPSLVDRENVKANLKDGVLSIVVPKVERKERRIVVE